MEKKDLTATRWFTSRLHVFLLVLMGVFFAFEPSWLGWKLLAEWVGGRDRLLAIGLGVLFVLVAIQSFERDQLRVQVAETLAAMHQLLYGKDYARDREAIRILLVSIGSQDPEVRRIAHENLRRLTGQEFAEDPAVWRSWWELNERTWARKKSAEKPGTEA